MNRSECYRGKDAASKGSKMGRVLRNRSDGYFEEKNITAQQCAEADLAFGLESSLVLSSALNQVQWLVVSSRPSRPSGLALCVGRKSYYGDDKCLQAIYYQLLWNH